MYDTWMCMQKEVFFYIDCIVLILLRLFLNSISVMALTEDPAFYAAYAKTFKIH